METTEIAPLQKPNKKLLIWAAGLVLALLLAFLIYYMVMLSLAAHRWVKETNLEHASKNEDVINPLLANDETYVLLQKKISFAKARLKMASTDSIGLALNLPDSIIALEISGVTVSSVKVPEIRQSRTLSGIEHGTLAAMLSKPLLITHSIATIVKEPIIEKLAPRDAEEASVPDNIPDTARNEPVFFQLTLENGIRLMVLQHETTSGSDRRNRRHFLLKRSLAYTWKNLRSVIRFKIPDYSPEILIMIPGADARAIYRAIPEYGKVSILL